MVVCLVTVYLVMVVCLVTVYLVTVVCLVTVYLVMVVGLAMELATECLSRLCALRWSSSRCTLPGGETRHAVPATVACLTWCASRRYLGPVWVFALASGFFTRLTFPHWELSFTIPHWGLGGPCGTLSGRTGLPRSLPNFVSQCFVAALTPGWCALRRCVRPGVKRPRVRLVPHPEAPPYLGPRGGPRRA